MGAFRLGARLMRDDLAGRTAHYAALRDGGLGPVDAGSQLGVSSSTRARYERWYRSVRGLPAPRSLPFEAPRASRRY